MVKILRIFFVFLVLPVSSFSFSSLPEFSAVYNSRKKTVAITWKHQSAEVKTYIVQHSDDNKKWTDIAVQELSRAEEARSFYFEDKKPGVGENDYRLKCTYKDGKTDYSLTVTVMIGSPTKSWVMYPVPVTNLLNLDYRGTETIKGVINVIIQQPAGKVFTKLRYSSLSRQIKIPVDNLPKGIYDIRIIVQNEVIWDQRFLK